MVLMTVWVMVARPWPLTPSALKVTTSGILFKRGGAQGELPLPTVSLSSTSSERRRPQPLGHHHP